MVRLYTMVPHIRILSDRPDRAVVRFNAVIPKNGIVAAAAVAVHQFCYAIEFVVGVAGTFRPRTDAALGGRFVVAQEHLNSALDATEQPHVARKSALEG